MRGRIIGQPLPRVEGADKVSGALFYTADHYRPGTLWGKVLRSPYPHARVLNVDVEKARALPGVHAVITGQDIPPTLVGRRLKDVPVLAREVARFVGDRVAALAAEDADLADEALGLIDVEY